MVSSVRTTLRPVFVVDAVRTPIGKFAGARLGAEIVRADKSVKNWMGVALLPQAGVAIGMSLMAVNHFPDHRQTLLPIVIGSTVFFEVVGPVFTRLALKRAQAG